MYLTVSFGLQETHLHYLTMLCLSLVSVWEISTILSMQDKSILFHRTSIFKTEMGKWHVKFKIRFMYMYSLEVFFKKNSVAFDSKKTHILIFFKGFASVLRQLVKGIFKQQLFTIKTVFCPKDTIMKRSVWRKNVFGSTTWNLCIVKSRKIVKTWIPFRYPVLLPNHLW